MDILAGLSVIGDIINSKQTENNIKVQSKKNKNNDPKNIYNNNRYNSVEKEINQKANKRFNDSKNSKYTGVIPKQYNKMSSIDLHKKEQNYELFSNSSDSEFSDEEQTKCSSNLSQTEKSESIDATNPGIFIDKCNKFLDNRKHERKFVKKVNDDNNFLNQFEELKFDNAGPPVSQNGVVNGMGMDTVVQRMEQERAIALKEGFSNFGESNDMTYGVTEPQDFIHNNMKPNFKQRGVGNQLRTNHGGRVFQQKMELFSGSLNENRPDWNHKTEQAPLFNPTTNIANIYGLPSMTNFEETRYIPGKERRNEKPFQPIKVTPGIGLGTNEKYLFYYWMIIK